MMHLRPRSTHTNRPARDVTARDSHSQPEHSEDDDKAPNRHHRRPSTSTASQTDLNGQRRNSAVASQCKLLLATVTALLALWWRYIRLRRRTSFLLGLSVGSMLIYSVYVDDSAAVLLLRERMLALHQLRDLVSSRSSLADFMPPIWATSDYLANFTLFLLDTLPSSSSSSSPSSSSSATQQPARLLLKQNYTAHYPVFLVPGIVSTSLESWSHDGGCAEAYFRRKVWGDLTMATALLLDKECWVKHLMLDSETGTLLFICILP
jgi:hypothetical protein